MNNKKKKKKSATMNLKNKNQLRKINSFMVTRKSHSGSPLMTN